MWIQLCDSRFEKSRVAATDKQQVNLIRKQRVLIYECGCRLHLTQIEIAGKCDEIGFIITAPS